MGHERRIMQFLNFLRSRLWALTAGIALAGAALLVLGPAAFWGLLALSLAAAIVDALYRAAIGALALAGAAPAAMRTTRLVAASGAPGALPTARAGDAAGRWRTGVVRQ